MASQNMYCIIRRFTLKYSSHVFGKSNQILIKNAVHRQTLMKPRTTLIMVSLHCHQNDYCFVRANSTEHHVDSSPGILHALSSCLNSI